MVLVIDRFWKMLRHTCNWLLRRDSTKDAAKQVLKDNFAVNGQVEVPSVSAWLQPACNDIMHFSIDMPSKYVNA